MYRKILLASVGAIALTGSATFAADLPSRAPPPVYLPPPPIFTWTGIYIGGQVGYAWGSGSSNVTGFDPDIGISFATSLGSNPNGVIGGGHVGYNLQINQWVLGLEGTVDGTSLSRTIVLAVPPGHTLTATGRSDVQGSIRGRVGIAFDRALIYATGGVAFGGFNADLSFLPDVRSRNFSNTRVGWTVGGGIEYAVTNNWSIRAEYRYSDFGRTTDTVSFGTGGFVSANRHFTQNQVQAGISYKFDMWAPYPVVAKY